MNPTMIMLVEPARPGTTVWCRTFGQEELAAIDRALSLAIARESYLADAADCRAEYEEALRRSCEAALMRATREALADLSASCNEVA